MVGGRRLKEKRAHAEKMGLGGVLYKLTFDPKCEFVQRILRVLV